MKITVTTLQLTLWNVAALIGQSDVKASGTPPFRAYFDVPLAQPDMRILDCAFQPGRFFFISTKPGRSELIATDADGRVTARTEAKSPANHIYPRCTLGGVLAARPTRDGGTNIEEYSTDLSYVRSFVLPGGFVGGLCLSGAFAGLGPGTVASVDPASGLNKSSPLSVAGDDPVLVTQADHDSFVLVRQFSGILQHVGADGKLKHQTPLTGPGLNELRAIREAEDGLFAPGSQATVRVCSSYWAVIRRTPA